MAANPALEAALALARTPTLVHAMRRQPLPPGVPVLLRIVAGEPGAVQEAVDDSGREESHLVAVAELYVQQVMLFSGAEPYRVMGVAPGAARTEMRKNLRWLMTWLHPDKNAAEWRSAFASRVLEAWHTVSTPVTQEEQEPEMAFASAAAAAPAPDGSGVPTHFTPDNRPFRNPAPWKQTVAERPKRRRVRRRQPRSRVVTVLAGIDAETWLRSAWNQVRDWLVTTIRTRKIPRRVLFVLIMIAVVIPGAYLLAAERPAGGIGAQIDSAPAAD